MRKQKDKTVASPNLSKSRLSFVTNFVVEMVPDPSDSILEANEPSGGMLAGLNDDIDNDQMPSDEDLDGDDDPEMLAELEKRQE